MRIACIRLEYIKELCVCVCLMSNEVIISKKERQHWCPECLFQVFNKTDEQNKRKCWQLPNTLITFFISSTIPCFQHVLLQRFLSKRDSFTCHFISHVISTFAACLFYHLPNNFPFFFSCFLSHFILYSS